MWRTLTLAAALTLGGCVTDEARLPMAKATLRPAAGQGRIVVIRDTAYYGVAVGWDVKLDGQLMAELKHGTYASADVPAGRHRLTSTAIGFPGTTQQDVTVGSGQSQYLLLKMSDRATGLMVAQMAGGLAGYALVAAASSNAENPGPFSLVPVDEATAQQKMAELKPAT
jgi:hypothetical protein